MANILFPDVWGTIGKVAAIENADAQRNYLAEDRKAKQSAAPFVQKALQGDRDALNEVATRHPDTAMKLAPLFERMDAAQRTKTKEAAEFTASAANAVLQADPAERGAIYAQILADGKARGFDLSRLPPQYTPQMDGQLRTYRSMAIPVLEHFKRSENEPKPMAPLGGGPGGGDAAGVIGGMESSNRYDAVGPRNPDGDYAYGKYQVKGTNIGPWTQEVLGRSMTPQEFLKDEKAQDAIFRAKFGQYQQKYGPEGAARAWFAGENGMNNPNARDVNGMTVQRYGQKFTAGMGGPQAAQMPQPPQGMAVPGTPAPMPQPPQGMAIPGTPAQMPSGPPGMAQGEGGPPGSPAGNGPQPQQAQEVLTVRQYVHSKIPGAAPLTVNGMIAYDKQGRAAIQLPNGQRDFIDVPKPKEPPADKGLFGDSLLGRALTALRTMNPATQDYAAAYAILSKPQVISDGAGGQQVIQPMDLSMFPKPAFGGGGQPMPGGPTTAGAPPPSQTQIPGGGTVTRLPGAGKPLDNSARDDLVKKAGPALEMAELVKSFDPSFGGYMIDALGEGDNFRKRNLPDSLGGADPRGQAQWWQRYQAMSNLERNALFGASLTAGEQAAWKAATSTPGMKPEQIRENLQRQNDIAQKALSRLANSLAKSGYSKEAIEAATGVALGDLPSPMGGVPAPDRGAPPAPAVDLKKKYRLE